jgi:hypothetical protein
MQQFVRIRAGGVRLTGVPSRIDASAEITPTSRLQGTTVLEARFIASLRIADNSEVFIGASRRNGKNQLDR